MTHNSGAAIPGLTVTRALTAAQSGACSSFPAWTPSVDTGHRLGCTPQLCPGHIHASRHHSFYIIGSSVHCKEMRNFIETTYYVYYFYFIIIILQDGSMDPYFILIIE